MVIIIFLKPKYNCLCAREKQRSQIMITASCGDDIKLIKWPSATLIAEINAPDNANEYIDVTWSNDGNYLAAVPNLGNPSVLNIIHLSEHENQDQFIEYDFINYDDVTTLTYSKEQKEIVCVTTKNCDVFTYNLQTQEVVADFNKAPDLSKFVEFAANDAALIVACRDSRMYLYNAHGVVMSTFCVPQSSTLTSLKAHPCESNLLVASSKEGVVSLWDLNNLDVISLKTDHDSGGTQVDFSRRDLYGSAGYDKTLFLYDLRTNAQTHRKVHEHPLTSFTFNHMYGFVLGMKNDELIYYDIRKLSEHLSSMQLHNTHVKKLIFQQNISGRMENFVPAASGDCQININKRIAAGMDKPYPSRESFSTSVIEPDDVSVSTSDKRRNPNPKNKNSTFFDGTSVSSSESRLNFSSFDNKELPCDAVSRRAEVRPNTTSTRNLINSATLGANIDMEILPNAGETIVEIERIKNDILDLHKRSMEKLIDNMNNRFLKMRLNVSRLFCGIENHNKKRWNLLHSSLQRLVLIEDKMAECEHVELKARNKKKPEEEYEEQSSLHSCRSVYSKQ